MSIPQVLRSTKLLTRAVKTPTYGLIKLPAARSLHTTASKLKIHTVHSQQEFREGTKDCVALVDFFATWCGPCKAMAPTLLEASNDELNKSFKVIKVDVDEVPEVASSFGIRAMPTFMVLKNGEKVEEMLGANPGGLVQLFAKHREAANAMPPTQS